MELVSRLRAENISAIHSAREEVIGCARGYSHIQRIVQFGSTARGCIEAMSELDLLVVMETKQNFFLRNAEMLKAVTVPVDVDILCHSPEEINANRHRPFFRHVLREGITIYEK